MPDAVHSRLHRTPWALAVAMLAGCAALPAANAPAGEAAKAQPPATAAAKPPAAAAASPSSPSAPAASAAPGARPSPAPAPGAAAATPPTPPGSPPPFAVVTKDAKRTDGLLPVWTKDDKTWLEIPEALLGQPLMFSINRSHGLGERRLHGSTMGPSWLVAFVRMGQNQVQLQALNTTVVAQGKAQKFALEEGFSRSLLTATPVASAPHLQSKALLVDASFLLGDIAQYGRALEAATRLSYQHDRGNSHIRKALATPQQTSLHVQQHFYVPRIPLPPPVPTPMPQPQPPQTLPDPRSLLVGVVYNFVKLPATPMATREADGRLGHFYDTVLDFTNDQPVRLEKHYINRWRLEKKDPTAPVSEPVKPIVFWIDKNVPTAYRDAVREGVLAWNKAFERAGFKNAVQVQQQPDDADWDTMDGVHASVRWYFGLDSGSATGPSHTDPRTGEILDADIRIGDDWGRYVRGLAVEQVGSRSEDKLARLSQQWRGGRLAEHSVCDFAEQALGEVAFARASLEAQGLLRPDSPEAEALVQGVIREVVMHEVGHTLGLKHNFKASTVYTQAQLRDPAFVATNGLTSSVMDYNAYNLPLPGESRSGLFNTSVGPYDVWAIEYAYKPLEPKDERAELERIASRSTEPLLAFADDMDAGGFGNIEGFDPKANRFDLGNEPLEFFERRLKLTQELWKRAEGWKPLPGEGTARQRNMLATGFSQLRNAAALVSKYVGGMNAVREVPGTPGAAGRSAAFTPVPAAQQRQALQFLAKGLFSADSFRLSPGLLANVLPDYVEFDRREPISITAAVLRVQTTALDRLMAAGTAQRVLDASQYVAPAERGQLLSLNEVYATLQGAVWSELAKGGDIEPLRRNLQREHLRRVQALLLRGSAMLQPDALSLVRWHANELKAQLDRAAKNTRLGVDTRAHLQDSQTLLAEALKATFQRM